MRCKRTANSPSSSLGPGIIVALHLAWFSVVLDPHTTGAVGGGLDGGGEGRGGEGDEGGDDGGSGSGGDGLGVEGDGDGGGGEGETATLLRCVRLRRCCLSSRSASRNGSHALAACEPFRITSRASRFCHRLDIKKDLNACFSLDFVYVRG